MKHNYLFYPGCAMQRNARPYYDSLMAIAPDIESNFQEVQDWNCCGATEYASVHRIASYALIARNLALAAGEINGAEKLVASCSACYLNLAKTDSYLRSDPELEVLVNEALAAGDLSYEPGSVGVRHLLDVIVNEIGLAAIGDKVVRPLHGLRVAPYYGCVIVRPDPDKRFGNHEYPTEMDMLLKMLGAEVIDFPLKTHCCGGHMSQISQNVAFELIRRLLDAASDYRADLMVTLCPMCQFNLDAYQGEVNRHFHFDFQIPILYFTQLMGLAFGHEPVDLGLGRGFVDPNPALAKIGVEVVKEEPKPRPRRRRDDPSLPMPVMPQGQEGVQ